MSKTWIIATAIAAAILLGVLPLVAVDYLARERAVKAEVRLLTESAFATVRLADLELTRAEAALGRLRMEIHDPRSEPHVERMRQLSITVLSVEDIAYEMLDGQSCDSWGNVYPAAAPKIPDAVFPNGFALQLHQRRLGSPDDMIALGEGRYQVFVQSRRLIDIPLNSPMIVGVATEDGKVIAVSGMIAAAMLTRLVGSEISGDDGTFIFSSRRGENLIAFAISDYTASAAHLRGQMMMLAPIGGLISLLLVGSVAWILYRRLSLPAEMARAISRDEFVVHYQPIMEISSGHCVGAEALVRWARPDGTSVSPDLFIAICEENNLIGPLTDLVIKHVVRDMRATLLAYPDIHIAINIAAQDIESGRFLSVLNAAVSEAAIPKTQIWLEATERGFMNLEPAQRTIQRAKDQGYSVAIDDFGTGYSSLSMLETLPVDVLKIDKAFVSAIGRGAATSVVTPHIIEMAHALKLGIVAEGVETKEQELYLKQSGVQLGQGWLYSKAMRGVDFTAFVQRTNAADSAESAASDDQPVARA